nr:hypothetical protein 14 [Coxiellaceae bacterium]
MHELTSLQQTIQRTLRRQLANVCTCEWYPVMRQAMVAPAVLLELTAMYPAENAGTQALALQLRFEARVVVDYGVDQAVLAAAQLALQLACVVNNNTWDCPVTPARLIQATPDAFRPELDAYSVWLVEWQQQGRFGQSVWARDASDTAPHTVTVGIETTTGEKGEKIGGKIV